MAALDRCQERQDNDHRFARSDLSLEQTVHGLRRHHVLQDVGEDVLLVVRQAVGKTGAEPPVEVSFDGVSYAALRVEFIVCAGFERHLDPEELVEDEPPPCRCYLGDVLWEVDARERRVP